MAAMIVSTATGFWDDGATWVGGVAPVNGDTVQIAAHTVTVRTNRTVGHSPAENDTTPAIDFTNVAGKLIIDGVVLTVRGDIRMLGNTTVREQIVLQVAAGVGAVLEFDASQAASPTSQNYRLMFNANASSQYAKLRCIGTSASAYCQVRSNASGGNAFFTRLGNFSTGMLEADFTLFQRIGDATNPFFNTSLGNVSQSQLSLRDVVFDGCGKLISTISAHATADCELRRVTWKNTADASRSAEFGKGPATNKAFFTECYPDKEVSIADLGNWTLDDSVFGEALAIAGTNAWDSAQRIFQRILALKQVNGPVVDWYVMIDHTAVNPHALQPRSAGIAASFDGVIFDYPGTSRVGDLININAGAAGGRSVVAQRCIVLRNGNGHQPGKLLSILGANNRVEAYHNTIISSGDGTQSECGVIEYGEGGSGVDGDILGCKSNLVIGSLASSGVVLSRDIANTTQLGTLTTASMFSHNGKYQARTSCTDADGYHAYHVGATKIFSTGVPGSNDVTLSADPCVDSTRNARTWDVSLGGPGTNANVMTELRKRFDFTETWNSAYKVADLMTYIRAGFEVTDASLQNAGHDGVTIGACIFSPPPSGGGYKRRSRPMSGGFQALSGGMG